MIAELEELEEFRQEVRGWCGKHVPADWVRRMTGVSIEESLDFQRAWLAEQRAGGFAAPHWSAEWITWEYECHLYLKRALLNRALLGDSRWHQDRAADLLLGPATCP